MCQSKSQGGKRCAIHHHGTQAAVQTTSVKTGVDTNDVKDVFSELNKEGKKLPSPSRQEYESYLEKERFLTEIDPSIPERDKKMILKKIQKAKEENTPSGGTFHAWKNLLTVTLQKFKTKSKLFLAGLGIAAITFGTAGCAGLPQNNNSGIDSQSAAVSLVYDSVPVASGEQVTDELGTYAKVKTDPTSELYKVDFNHPLVNMEGISASGYTEQDVTAANKAVIDFVTTEMFDNASVDLPATAGNTLVEIDNKYGLSQNAFKDDFINASVSKLVYLQNDGITYVRDGKPRIASNNTYITEISNYENSNGMGIIITGISDVKYRISQSGAGEGYKNSLVKANWSFLMMPDSDGQWKISGYSNEFITSLEK